MSNEENIKEELESVKNEAEDTIEEDSDKAKAATDAAKETGNKALASILAIKDEKPKVFYGVVGAVVLLLLIMMMGGDDRPKITQPAAVNLQVGKSYALKSPNTYVENSTVRLALVPGSMAAYDDTEEADRSGCLHLPQGTPVTVTELTDAFGQKNAYAKVVADAGECKGKGGWALAINIQPK